MRTDIVISSCSDKETDQNLVRHMLQCLLTGIKTIVVKTVDTDVFLLLLSYRASGGNFSSKVFVQLGISKLNSCFYSINDIALDLGEELCQFWDRWFDFENKNLLTKVSSELSQRPTNITVEQTTHLEK